jgi:hypothetical protein
MSDVLILIFVLYIIYLIMKKAKTTPEKPMSEAKSETKPEIKPAPVAAPVAKPAPKKAPVEAAKATVEAPPAPEVSPAKAAPKKPGAARTAPQKAEKVVVEPVAAPDIPVKDRIGLTAGRIWQYLADQGATPVAKLMRELPEEEKIIHRSIGWLAQEGKITLAIVDRAETIALKD